MKTFNKTKIALLMAALGFAVTGCENKAEEAPFHAAENRPTEPDIITPTDSPAALTPGPAGTESQAPEDFTDIGSDQNVAAGTATVGADGRQVTSPTTAPAQSLVNAIYETVGFEGVSSSLTRDAQEKLQKLAQEIEPSTPVALTVRTRTSASATESGAGNEVLAQQRSHAIREYLSSQGVKVIDSVVDTLGGDQGVRQETEMAMKEQQQAVIISISSNDGDQGLIGGASTN